MGDFFDKFMKWKLSDEAATAILILSLFGLSS